jgi:hypothetical protein
MRRALLSALLLLALPAVARADDYFVAVFCAESVPFRSTNTHSFASIVRVPTNGAAELDAICWGPANMKVRGLTLKPEEGKNLGLTETLDWMKGTGWRVSVWGPFKVERELYCALKAQADTLNSGTVKYKPTDTFQRRTVAQNCYHALTSPVAPLKRYAGAFTAGDAAGTTILQAYKPWLIDPCTTHDEILTLTGADKYELTRRSYSYQPGRADAIRSAVGR